MNIKSRYLRNAIGGVETWELRIEKPCFDAAPENEMILFLNKVQQRAKQNGFEFKAPHHDKKTNEMVIRFIPIKK